MQLTAPQLATLKTWVQQNHNSVFDESTLTKLNAAFNPAYFVWRTSADKHEYTQQTRVGDDGTTPTAFTWGGAQGGYIARSQGERDAFKELFNSTLTCNPSLPNVRVAFDDIFSGSGAGAVGNRNHCRAVGRRACTVVEKLFAVQTVGGPAQSGARGTRTNPDTLGVGADGAMLDGLIDLATVQAADA